ncbi:MAG TPA: hypothetical protein VJB57_06200, partial [Dehalococcoidia bacterium]|nr:hypothetical protein [Dehalococcoidia bacterium]
MTAFPLRYAATLATTAFLVMLALSCKGNDSDEPAVVPTLASSPQAPTVPRPSPTPTRSPTPRPQPTQPRAVATPPSTLSYSFGPGVDVGDRAVIGNAIEVSRRILASYGAGEPPCTVLAFDTLTGLSQAYARAAGSQGWRAADVVRRLLNGVAEAGYRTVSIYTNSSFWRDANAVERSQAVS